MPNDGHFHRSNACAVEAKMAVSFVLELERKRG
jgi:hypothetical protein